jgi:hypothetical protein
MTCGGSAELLCYRGAAGLCSTLVCAGDDSAPGSAISAAGAKATPPRCEESANDGVEPYCCPKPRALAMLHRSGARVM